MTHSTHQPPTDSLLSSSAQAGYGRAAGPTAILREFPSLLKHASILRSPTRQQLIEDILRMREALLTESGALATWNPADSTARIPLDTYIVRDEKTERTVDWNASDSHSMSPVLFQSLMTEAVEVLSEKPRLYLLERSVGADPHSALGLQMISDSPTITLFGDNMFRPPLEDPSASVLGDRPFLFIVLPHDRIRGSYEALRKVQGKMVPQVIVMDAERRIGLVYGTSYLGAVKKMLFTAMNYLLPPHGILPLHCAAAMDKKGSTHLFLGLSGTGKTTLSTDSDLSLIGDDEHVWSKQGIAEMEGGCYAKLIGLSKEKEPQIYEAVFTKRSNLENGCIIENVVTFPDGSMDLDDERLTENSRASYPLSFLKNIVDDSRGPHPSSILFLTADAEGVLPPLSSLTLDQASLWFLMGYTSKLAGAEAGSKSPQAAFSRFFGAPFMPRKVQDYLAQFREYVTAHGSRVYLLNTGWVGGPYGVGKRMDITPTRLLAKAAMSGDIDEGGYTEDSRFHLRIPRSCPGVDVHILNPRNLWTDPNAYDQAADMLAKEFAASFMKQFGCENIDPAIAAQCPGR